MLPFMAPMMMQGAAGGAVTRPQDVFATSLYTGNGAAQAITNGIDLLGQGGLVWGKVRDAAFNHELTDTARGSGKSLATNTTTAERTDSDLRSFTSSGFNLRNLSSNLNEPNKLFAAWSFRRALKLFDIVTYTGDGTSGRQIPHGLGVAPGMVVVKRLDSSGDWPVYHRSGAYLLLNSVVGNDQGSANDGGYIDSPNSTYFRVYEYNGLADVNAFGGRYVAYLFAHDPDPVNGIIQCVSSTGTGAQLDVTLGWRPQFLIQKRTSATSSWRILDAARGQGSTLLANMSDAETAGPNVNLPTFTSTGFTIDAGSADAGSGVVNVYLAIRAPI